MSSYKLYFKLDSSEWWHPSVINQTASKALKRRLKAEGRQNSHQFWAGIHPSPPPPYPPCPPPVHLRETMGRWTPSTLVDAPWTFVMKTLVEPSHCLCYCNIMHKKLALCHQLKEAQLKLSRASHLLIVALIWLYVWVDLCVMNTGFIFQPKFGWRIWCLYISSGHLFPRLFRGEDKAINNSFCVNILHYMSATCHWRGKNVGLSQSLYWTALLFHGIFPLTVQNPSGTHILRYFIARMRMVVPQSRPFWVQSRFHGKPPCFTDKVNLLLDDWISDGGTYMGLGIWTEI